MKWLPGVDPVPWAVRQSRDDYFDQLIGLPSALTPESAKSRGFSEGAYTGLEPEIPNIPDGALMIAKFMSYQTVLSSSGRSVYIEALFSVLNVFEDAAGNSPGATVTLIIPGGTVQTETGAVISYLTQPRQYSVVVGGTYLLDLALHASGKFYLLGKDWDLTSGTVRLNSSVPGKPSTLIGLNMQQLIDKLDAQFGIQK